MSYLDWLELFLMENQENNITPSHDTLTPSSASELRSK